MKLLGHSKVAVKKRVTLPDGVCELLGIEPGDFLLFMREGSRVYLSKGQLRPATDE